MKVVADIPRHFQDALGVFEALRRLGFPSDNIFVTRSVLDELPSPLLSVGVKWRGTTFIAGVAFYNGTEDQLTEDWRKICDLVSDAPEEELQALYAHSSIMSDRKNREALVYGLAAKGIYPPVLLN